MRHTDPGPAAWWTSALTACFLATSTFAGLKLVATETWLDHPYAFLNAWVPVTAMALLATWHLASAAMVPLWLFAAYQTVFAIHESAVQGHPAVGRLMVATLILAWVSTMARWPRLRTVRAPSRSVLAVVGLAMTGAVTCYGAYQFGTGVFNPWTEYPAWTEEPGARDGLDDVSPRMVRSATAMDNTRFTLTYVLTPWDVGRRLTHGQADYLAHEVFCRDMSGSGKDGRLAFGFEFVDQGMAPLGTATMTAEACHG